MEKWKLLLHEPLTADLLHYLHGFPQVPAHHTAHSTNMRDGRYKPVMEVKKEKEKKNSFTSPNIHPNHTS